MAITILCGDQRKEAEDHECQDRAHGFTSGRMDNTAKSSPAPRIVIYRCCLGEDRCCACTGCCARCDMDERQGPDSGKDVLLVAPNRLERILCGIME